ncbi:MAG: Ni/Fe-hydrogenase, b-type cytochrome subunit [Candidatus Rokubacteria bacterium]|nr:Ni/Fe-hydrogenase, b-type cytochrome subunit [Candidatus Rokubacteria bacterium]
MGTTLMRRVYVWEFPVRLYHWVNALCVVVLAATGYLIGRPIPIAFSGEAWESYWFGWVRFLHFAFAFVFFFNFLGRLYWGFTGNRYARWDNFLPLTPALLRRQWREAVEVLKVDVLQARVRPMASIGHNALAGWTYFLTFLAFLFQSITGFGMYAAMSDAWLPRLFAWIVPLMGGDFAVRQWHHLMLWFFVIFSMVHVYLVFYHDYVEGRGVISSMAGGWKFVERQR